MGPRAGMNILQKIYIYIYMLPQPGIERFLERRTRSLITVATTLSCLPFIFRFEYASLSIFPLYETIGQQAELTYVRMCQC